MLKYILGGVALAVTGYGIKKYLEDEDNCRKVEDTVDEWLNKAEKGTDVFFDYANEKIDQLDVMLNGKIENHDDEVEESHDLTSQDKNNAQPKSWNKSFDWI